MDVLFLSVAAGGGHSQVAEVLKETIEEKYPGSRTLVVDTIKYINPMIDKVFVGGYLNTVKNTPQIYGKLYDFMEWGENMHDFVKTVNKLLSYRIKSLIDRFKPSVIVCTHPFPLQMISNIKKTNKIAPVAGILTDFAAHAFWLHDNIDAYIIANDSIKFDMVKRGIPEEIIYSYGIPISKRFSQKKDRRALLEEMGLEDKLTFLIMGGSLGIGKLSKIFQTLLKSHRDMQIIALTGRNTRLKRQLEEYSSDSDKKIKIMGFTDRVPDIMDIADFLITKPGGITVSEALAKELPILIISPIPGHEEKNENFLINTGVAARIRADENIDNIFSQVIDNVLRTKHMKEMAKSIARPDSCDDTVNLLELLSSGNTQPIKYKTRISVKD